MENSLSAASSSSRDRIDCPCGKRLLIPSELAGKKVKCPGCQRVLKVPAKDVAQPQAPSVSNHDSLEATAAGEKPAPERELTEFLAPAQQPDEIGRLGGYRVLSVLGKGGMGVVFLAEDVGLHRKVALKAMLPRLATSDTARERFFREARAAAALKHDHIVTIFQVGEDRGAPFLAMEFLEGEALDDRLKRGEPGISAPGVLPLAEVLRIGREVAEGLEHAHERGMIHRDIKPANVWLEASPRRKPGESRAKILDFGLARGLSDDTHITQSGVIVGTPAYMAPEQARGETVDHRCDLYSLGVLLYRLATGQMPFKGKDTMSLLSALALETPAEPRALNLDLPPDLNTLIMQLLAKDPKARPASAAEVAERLRDLEHDTSATQLRKPTQRTGELASSAPGGSPPSRKRRLPLFLSLGGAAVLALLLGIVLFWPTPHGLVRLECDDPNVEIVFDRNGPTIKGADKEPISLPAGEHGILVHRGDFTFETDRLLLRKGEAITLKLELVGNKLRLSRDGQMLGEGDAPLAKTFSNSLGMEFVLVPKGKAWLGGGGGKPGDRGVEITQDFYLGKYEVTQEEWAKLMGSRPSHFSRTGSGAEAVKDITNEELRQFPVEQVSWDDAQLFLTELNKREQESGWTYRLPKELEWEYACRGGPMSDKLDSSFNFYFEKPTDQLLPEQANFTPEADKGLRRTCKVGSYQPNKLGLYDMHCNVWEWCEDTEKAADGASVRVGRGGCWFDHSGDCRAVHRVHFAPSRRGNALGLRLARVPVDREIVAPPPKPPEPVKPVGALPPTYTNSLGMEFVLVPKGKSWLGGMVGMEGVKEVDIPHDFYLGKYEVTQEEWERVTGLNRSFFSRTGSGRDAVKDIADADLKRFPVENESWDDCQEFIKLVNERAPHPGWVYRLPTQAEWEYACRGGPTSNKFDCGFDFYFEKPSLQLQPEQANFMHGDKSLKRTCKVGSFQPNKLGLYDMHGNVWEWCNDEVKEVKNDLVISLRACRGGAWSHKLEGCRAGAPAVDSASKRTNYRGLRLARVPVSAREK